MMSLVFIGEVVCVSLVFLLFGIRQIMQSAVFHTVDTVSLGEFFTYCLIMVISFLGSYRVYYWVALAQIEKRKENTNMHKQQKEFYFEENGIDRFFTFSSIWIFIYSGIFYLMFALVLLKVKNSQQFLNVVSSGIWLFMAHCALWSAWPTTIAPSLITLKKQHYGTTVASGEQPIMPSFAMGFVKLVQKYDGQNTNAIPSAHCSLATMLMWILWKQLCYGNWVIIIPAIVAISCMKVKQHVFWDTILGSLFGTFMYHLLWW